MKSTVILLSIIAVFSQAHSQQITLEEILNRTQNALEAEEENSKSYIIEFTEKILIGKVDKEGIYDEADTIISRVKMQGDEELTREIIYSSSDDKDDRDDKKNRNEKNKLDIKSHLSIDDPNYYFELLEKTDNAYIISINPRKKKPIKDKLGGK
ncbi:MAG: hypothetical protein J7K40_14885 [candidate division Zixibacteria bacterium]|nr:hypothetical protein [candidate division Zixibacteria bacterium]